MGTINPIIMGQILNYCECIKNGVKPIAILPIQKRYEDEAVEYIRDTCSLHLYSEELSEGWISLAIFKNEYMHKSLTQKPKFNI